MISIRAEQAQDARAVRRVNEQAFETAAEADLVDLLRAHGKLVVSLVAWADDQVVGHIAFSPVTIVSSPHPQFYPRFGFAPASRFGIRSAWPAPDDAFMALELRPGALAEVAGLAAYEPEFNEV